MGLLFFSCQDDLFVDLEPSFTIKTIEGNNVANIYEEIEIVITGDANKMTLFTGNAHRQIDSVGVDPLTTGLYVKKGDIIKIKYVVKGKYTIALLGTSYDKMGENIQHKEFTHDITITDIQHKNDVRDLFVQADGGKVFFPANKYLKDIDSLGVPDASFEAPQLVRATPDDDGNFYIKLYCEFRQGRSKDNKEQFAKYSIEIPYANSGFNYYLGGDIYTVPTLKNLYRDQEKFLFDVVNLEYAPTTLPDDVTKSAIYLMPIPELKKLTFKDSKGKKVDDIITESFNPIFGETKPVYTEYFPDYNDPSKFYGIINYDETEKASLGNLTLQFEHRLPANMVEVKYQGKVLTGDGSETIDLSSGMARLQLTYTDAYFISKGVDVNKAQSVSILDIYAFKED